MLAPEEDEVSVHEDGLLHVWEHVGDEESLGGAQSLHVPHVPPLLNREHGTWRLVQGGFVD